MEGVVEDDDGEEIMSLFRHPRTAQEKRAYYRAVANDVALTVQIRGRRKPARLADVRDDLLRLRMRSWKSFRWTQWRGGY